MARITIGRAMLESRPHVLYRFYDRTDVLLYVGITADLAARMATHEREKDWWPRVDRAATRIEYYDCRSAALVAEREAIMAESPLFNDQHNQWVEVPELFPRLRMLDDFVEMLIEGASEEELVVAMYDNECDWDGNRYSAEEQRTQAAFYLLMGIMSERWQAARAASADAPAGV